MPTPRYLSLESLSASAQVQPLLMAVLNVTPDSFSDGGRFNQRDVAFDRAMSLIADGADILDIGGESTRPGASEVSVQEELDRVVPVVEKIVSEQQCLISVDSSKVEVMHAAVAAGAKLINDVRGLADDQALQFAAGSGLPVCVMHMQGNPQSMQNQPSYNSVVDEVVEYLRQRIAAFVAAGGDPLQIIVDPGFGFGKSLQHNLALFAKLETLHQLEAPILIGVSRKSMFGDLLGRGVDERKAASVVAASMLLEKGAAIVRAHDVAETRDAIKLWHAVQNAAG